MWKWKQCCLAAVQCCDLMLRTPPNGKEGPYCPRTWDGWQCWNDTPGGATAIDICEGHIYFDNEPPSCPNGFRGSSLT
ncbi:calcitonin-related peptide type 1 receptor [Caerostris extrusa]|uniref:Calcitonin-related peptide type 1 receptor n=1 Tax=Caerostris extrusa TaxID=172846 RepID=A0AAV4TZK8_CAEEX|nr:calcitonin-related peptide type 1 receptor [Caerostris extrusa]